MGMSTASVVDRVLATERVPFPWAAKPAGVAVGRWDLNEFTRGGWSYHKPGWRGAEHMNALVAPVRGFPRRSRGASETCRLFFAGEATSEGRPGYMDGAIESGWREAERLLEEHRGKSFAKAKL